MFKVVPLDFQRFCLRFFKVFLGFFREFPSIEIFSENLPEILDGFPKTVSKDCPLDFYMVSTGFLVIFKGFPSDC